ncbi:carbonic anhydrase [Paraphysoderma sedebokerense]|nr:carbonic anhydrase [Paraphysoderma sedebokerense]
MIRTVYLTLIKSLCLFYFYTCSAFSTADCPPLIPTWLNNLGLGPGELFVHRNVANLCLPNDLNLLSTLAYAVDYLKVEHIVVAGHYECGGVAAALSSQSYGLIDHWIKAIKDVYHRNKKRIQTLQSVKERARLLVELNVANSVFELSRSGIVQGAWKRDQPLKLHGWVYRLEDGILEDLGININKIDDVPLEYRV